ncbi:hypothetical protein INP77_11885 [Methylophilus sp. 13]|uniref:hypothetical protein n=1 Tax=Methylophilus sp. 13 TaxID=2781018 RepID=UPI00188EDE64|nr:hypothetical protein [Methylophilus sp. 13]MBF5040190.1 hypothetical protein [Methylophilus sp. 13]
MIHLALWIVSFLIVCAVISAIFSGLSEAISLPFVYIYNSIPQKYRKFLEAYRYIIALALLTTLLLFFVLKDLLTEKKEVKTSSKTQIESEYGNPWIVSTIKTSDTKLLLIVNLESDQQNTNLLANSDSLSAIKPFLCNGALKNIDLEKVEVSISLYTSTKKNKKITLTQDFCS